MNHTPKPWRVTRQADGSIAVVADNGCPVCTVAWYGPEDTQELAEAIAAMPELLAICKACLHQIGTDSDLDERVTRPDKYDSLEDGLRQAITKAAEGSTDR